ncbi:MAG TPA: Ig-like domain-containing protein, partial [Thermoleophilia bacterium]|nr:Ig-like domain-containing protein [Thermoleophilia bacterium]
VRVDATPPDLTVSGVDGQWHRAPVLALFSAQDATSGITGVGSKLDGAAGWTPGWAALVSADGDHTLVVRAVDAAGNETSTTVHVKVDTVGPVTSGLAVSARAGKKASFKVLVTDALSAGATTQATIVIKSTAGKTLKTLPAATVTIGTQATVSWARCSLKAGTYQYVVYASDAAGNAQSKAGGGRLVVK